MRVLGRIATPLAEILEREVGAQGEADGRKGHASRIPGQVRQDLGPNGIDLAFADELPRHRQIPDKRQEARSGGLTLPSPAEDTPGQRHFRGDRQSGPGWHLSRGPGGEPRQLLA